MDLVLLSGAHSHTAGYLKEIEESPDLRLVAAWDDMASRGRAVAERMGCEFVADVDAVLSRSGVDAAIVCADNAGHRPLVEACCSAGVDVFCEKPMALSLADAAAMLSAIDASGVRAVFGYFQPFAGAALAAREYLASGKLGEVTQIRYRNAHHAAYGHWFDSEDRQWFTDPSRAGGGAFLDMGTHAIHFVRSVFGPVAAVSAAVIENKSGVYPDVDDYGVAVLEFESGVTGIVEASWVFTGGPRGLEAVGSGGRLELDGAVQVASFDGKPGEMKPVPDVAPEPTRLRRLLALKDGSLSPEKALGDLICCRDAVAIMTACYEAARSGTRQIIDPGCGCACC
ncbi:MAG: Gfo/Idh/MocA family oxidoreductase [Lentisphaerae bacterium]|jgi:predicted dehydrogenase|nr:Gfo/Idh/MocA family oxidoreductase [Lentisphaerota bacterium]MBT4815350.1 Gfo/Idh/MocA family oxidoreductase [Lentisphaerota bacterium]MBT5608887.1 Gfo/Idh/MocA family oxidoreductase [Lentisphaerota bacterium]MBT7057401.1 Gfo/Idh/MocA family oxidoreductase [Lentisphaerota bacterium]MBT7842753.1 Gfo/Idh/MocA family oxidoreductase [Lentisphaerota bacterium]